ncbi:carbohydrate ABC transporter permease [Trueperella pyogenes]|uniref:carbohydrate ABC transporter permease n=1 Tax=Trueperella pyogenes TaxID=1661 RepID=UPI003DA90BDB
MRAQKELQNVGGGRSRMRRLQIVTSWSFIIPASLLILVTSFWPMAEAFILSFQTGKGTRLNFAEPLWMNYQRLLDDEIFMMTLTNTVIYLVVQVPIMLVAALILAVILNRPGLKFKAFGARPSFCRVRSPWCRTRWSLGPFSLPMASSTRRSCRGICSTRRSIG